MREAWTRWQGQVLNGTFPLHRYLGGSDHSGVFLTEDAARQLPEVAVKLVPAIPTLAESQLSQWNTAAGLAHPHLVRIFETDQCRLGGLPYLYAVMEFSDQNLAQLLQARVLTEEEARDMLLPILDALQFLHDRNLVHGRLKPANILVVGDQLKLARDTICGVGDATASINMASVYDSPEARDGSRSTASDVWALGVSLYEALTRDPPTGIEEPGVTLVLPRHFPAAFRELVTRCLARRAADRPKVREIEASSRGVFVAPAPSAVAPEPLSLEWAQEPASRAPAGSAPTVAGGAPAESTASKRLAAQPAQVAPPAAAAKPAAPKLAAPPPAAVKPAAAKPAASAPLRGSTSAHPAQAVEAAGRPDSTPQKRPFSDEQAAEPRSYIPMIVGAVAVLALVWFAVRAFRSHPSTSPPAVEAPAPTASQPAADTGSAAQPAPGAHDAVPPKPSARGSAGSMPARTARGASMPPRAIRPAQVSAGAPTVHEEIPNVPRSARMTIHGHVRVSVRLMVNKDGTVFAALVDNHGPSRYFERLAIEAAKKWRFTAVDSPDRRLELVRFDFTRDGAAAHTVEVH